MTLPTDLDFTPGDPNKPLVLLLHGNGGNKDHMVNPAVTTYNYDFRGALPADREIGWSWYPGVGIWSVVPDQPKDVVGWRQAVQQAGYRTAAYSQVGPRDLLAPAVQELGDVMTHLRVRYPGTPVVLLAHSRGGLLARKFLKDNAANAALVGSIAGLITLHSPHHGSTLANVANTLNTVVTALSMVNPVLASVMSGVRDEVNQPSYQELAVGGPFLTELQAGEGPVPGVAYATFGGTNPVLTRVNTWSYTVGSAIPQWNWPPYYHVISSSQVPIASPVFGNALCAEYLGSVPEVNTGGDILTTDSGARLPYAAMHKTNSLNHAEALWDPSLQQQVLQVLDVIRPDGSLVREANGPAVYVIFGGAKFWVPNPTVLQNYGGWAAVSIVADGTLAALAAIPRDGTVLKELSGAPVYVIRSGQKCWIPNPTVLQKYGGWSAVRSVPDGGLASIPNGPQAA